MSLNGKLSLKLKCKIARYFVLMVFSLVMFCGGVTFAENDLLYETLYPSQDLIIFPSKNSKRVGNQVFQGRREVDIFKDEDGEWDVDVTKVPNLFAKITRLLLILVITLSVTMILYNGVKYIVKVGQGEENSKELMKNVAFIIVGILVSLFSVVIITLLRSVPKSLDYDNESEGIPTSTNNDIDLNQIYSEADD